MHTQYISTLSTHTDTVYLLYEPWSPSVLGHPVTSHLQTPDQTVFIFAHKIDKTLLFYYTTVFSKAAELD